LLAKKLVESATPPAGMSQETLEEMRRTFGGPGTSFGDYLQYRVSSIGIHSKQAADGFWGIELILGGLAAGWVFYRNSGARNLPTTGPSARLDAARAPAKLEE
jgi:hypothetical protein